MAAYSEAWKAAVRAVVRAMIASGEFDARIRQLAMTPQRTPVGGDEP